MINRKGMFFLHRILKKLNRLYHKTATSVLALVYKIWDYLFTLHKYQFLCLMSGSYSTSLFDQTDKLNTTVFQAEMHVARNTEKSQHKHEYDRLRHRAFKGSGTYQNLWKWGRKNILVYDAKRTYPTALVNIVTISKSGNLRHEVTNKRFNIS